jgi:hypothetical protein
MRVDIDEHGILERIFGILLNPWSWASNCHIVDFLNIPDPGIDL